MGLLSRNNVRRPIRYDRLYSQGKSIERGQSEDRLPVAIATDQFLNTIQTDFQTASQFFAAAWQPLSVTHTIGSGTKIKRIEVQFLNTTGAASQYYFEILVNNVIVYTSPVETNPESFEAVDILNDMTIYNNSTIVVRGYQSVAGDTCQTDSRLVYLWL